MEDRNKYENCDACEQDFQNEINELVDNVENHSQKGHEQKEREVEEAFSRSGDVC